MAEIDARQVQEKARKIGAYRPLDNTPNRKAMELATFVLMKEWKLIAPFKVGVYRASIQQDVRSVGGELVGRAFTNVTARGFPYPVALEQSPRYHYRQGPFRGQKTAGRVKRILVDKRKEIIDLFQRARKATVDELAGL